MPFQQGEGKRHLLCAPQGMGWWRWAPGLGTPERKASRLESWRQPRSAPTPGVPSPGPRLAHLRCAGWSSRDATCVPEGLLKSPAPAAAPVKPAAGAPFMPCGSRPEEAQAQAHPRAGARALQLQRRRPLRYQPQPRPEMCLDAPSPRSALGLKQWHPRQRKAEERKRISHTGIRMGKRERDQL